MRETLARHSAGADPYNAALRATMIANGMSRAWAELLMACIAVDPAGRPKSVQEVIRRVASPAPEMAVERAVLRVQPSAAPAMVDPVTFARAQFVAGTPRVQVVRMLMERCGVDLGRAGMIAEEAYNRR